MATKHISDFQVCITYEACNAVNFAIFPYQLLHRATGQPEKVCFRAMQRAHKHNLIEYGVSLRTAWLTPKGISLISEGRQSRKTTIGKILQAFTFTNDAPNTSR